MLDADGDDVGVGASAVGGFIEIVLVVINTMGTLKSPFAHFVDLFDLFVRVDLVGNKDLVHETIIEVGAHGRVVAAQIKGVVVVEIKAFGVGAGFNPIDKVGGSGVVVGEGDMVPLAGSD